jgi:hypothetical protein
MGHDLHPPLVFRGILDLRRENMFQVKGIHPSKQPIGPKPLGLSHGDEDGQLLARWDAHFDRCFCAAKHNSGEKILSSFEEGKGVYSTGKVEGVLE